MGSSYVHAATWFYIYQPSTCEADGVVVIRSIIQNLDSYIEEANYTPYTVDTRVKKIHVRAVHSNCMSLFLSHVYTASVVYVLQ